MVGVADVDRNSSLPGFTWGRHGSRSISGDYTRSRHTAAGCQRPTGWTVSGHSKWSLALLGVFSQV